MITNVLYFFFSCCQIFLKNGNPTFINQTFYHHNEYLTKHVKKGLILGQIFKGFSHYGRKGMFEMRCSHYITQEIREKEGPRATYT